MINQEESVNESTRFKKKNGVMLSKPKGTKLRNIQANSSSSFTLPSATPSNHIRRAHVEIDGKRRKSSSKDDSFEELAHQIGTSFAAIFSQVLDEFHRSGKQIHIEQISLACTSVFKKSVVNVYGNRFDSLLLNFEKSFGSTLRTLWTIKEASVCRHQYGSSQTVKRSFADQVNKKHSSLPNNRSSETLQDIPSLIMKTNQIVSRKEIDQELASSSGASFVHGFNQSIMSTFVKSAVELARSNDIKERSNDLKALELGLVFEKLKLEESQLVVSSDLNNLAREKISLGTAKALFKEEKLRNQILDSRHADFARRCLDFLVSGLIIMLICLGYGAYTFSYQRIMEATRLCSATSKTASKVSSSWWPSSWWSSPWKMISNSMSSFSSGFYILGCHVYALSQVIFGLLMIMAIAYTVFQRSSMIKPTTMPVTFTLLLVFFCAFAGKLCIDTLGGDGYYWLLHWEILCLIHFLANVFPAVFYRALYGSISVRPQMGEKGRFVPYWAWRWTFYLALSAVYPAMCGLLPFASLGDWMEQFSEKLSYVYYMQG